jgi:cytochrome c biogenesis factor
LALAFDLPKRIEEKRLIAPLHILLALPFLVMAGLFLVDASNYRLVWEHGGSDLPLRYRLAALWEGREGPLLMWAASMALIGWFTRGRMGSETESTRRFRMSFFHGFSVFLLFLAWSMGAFDAANNPDAPRSQLNELLQTNLMVIHPPIIFLYYSFCIALTSIVLAHVFDPNCKLNSLKDSLIHLARPALFVGTLGIGLGGLWAYTVLDWGGYWAWDPVETASLLPWLALLVLLHMPQRPGKTDVRWWALAGLMPGIFALMSTLVTRANGVWVSRHAFVGDGSGAIPSDVWGRLMLLKGDIGVGIEVMGYLMLIILCASTWMAWYLRQELKVTTAPSSLPVNFITGWIVIPLSAIIVLLSPFNESDTALVLWGSISGIFLCIVGFSPLLSLFEQREALFLRLKRPTNLLILFGSIAAAIMSGDLILGALSILAVMPLITQDRPQDNGALLGAPILFWIFAAWAQVVEVQAAAIGMGVILIPWLLVNEDDTKRMDVNPLKWALMAPTTVGAAFILLTWLLMFASIDAPRLESHELLGTLLIVPIIMALTTYGWRKNMQQNKQVLIILLVLLSAFLAAAMFAESLPGDSSEVLSGSFVRGQVAWLLLLPLLMAIPSIARELALSISSLKKKITKRGRKGSSNKWRTTGAHMVHLGLLLLLLGHVFTTTLIERGDASHRQTLVKGEAKIIGDEAFIFQEVIIISDEDPEFDKKFLVGDGYIGVKIDIHEVVDGEVGDLLTTLEPGVLRFDSPNGRTTARSEISRHSRLHGDLVVIFDSSQASGLMGASFMSRLDDVDSVRVTIQDLNGSHFVWLGWSMMLLGLLAGSATWQQRKHDEEE